MVNMRTVSIISLSGMAYIIGRALINEYNYTTACLLSIVNVVVLLLYLLYTNKHKIEKIDTKTIIAGIFYTISLILYLESMNNIENSITIESQNVLLLIFGIVLILMMLGHTVTKGEAFGAFITIIGLLTIIKYSD
jgi:heme/copper-type cytochrome/quinol oxidase subunit 4